MNCGCLPQRYRSKVEGYDEYIWKWGGCSDNVKFGIKFSKMFVDAREKGDDLQSRVNRHNNDVGRRVSIYYCKRCRNFGIFYYFLDSVAFYYISV